MPTIQRKRRAQAEAEESPQPTRRRRSPSASEASSIEENADADIDEDTQAGRSHDQMVKKLVRLALASEFSRQPIRRTDITAKVMAPNTGRQFKLIFNEAQSQLRDVFGMELTELPIKEKVTITQKRAAQRSGTQSQKSFSKAYILTSTLPAAYRRPDILPPAKIPSTAAESSYVGLTTFLVALIFLSPGQSLAETRLERHLKRMNADNYALSGEKTEKVLKRMEREGYIVKVRERDQGGEETVDYIVGPRGRVEVGERGAAGIVREVYGRSGAEADELERRLVRSLGDVDLERKPDMAGKDGEEGAGEGGRGGAEEEEVDNRGGEKRQERRSSSRKKRRGRDEEEEEEVKDDEEEEEEDDEDDDEQ